MGCIAVSRDWRRLIAGAALLFVVGALGGGVLGGGILGGPAFAQSEERSASSAGPDPQAIEALIRTIEDDAEREALVAQLKTLADAQRALAAERTPTALVETIGARLLERLSNGVDRAAQRIGEASQSLAALPAWLAAVAEASADPGVRARWGAVAAKVLVVLGLAGIGQFAAFRLLRGARQRLSYPGPGWARRIAAGGGRIVVDAIPVLVFAAIAVPSLTLVEPQPVTRHAVLALINAQILVGLLLVVARFLLRPEAARLRFLSLGDATATACYRGLRLFVAWAVYGYFILKAAALLGIEPAVHQVALKIFGLSVAALLVVGIRRQRERFSAWLVAGDEAGKDGRLLRTLRTGAAGLWHWAAIAVVAVAYLAWAFEIEGAFSFLVRVVILTPVILLGLSLAMSVLERTLGGRLRGAPPAVSAGDAGSGGGWAERVASYGPVIWKIIRGALYLVAAILLLETWGIGVIAWLKTETARSLMSRLVAVGLVVGGAVLVWEFMVRAITNHLERRDESGRLVMESARARTLLGLLRTVIRVVLVVLVVLTVLSEFGIEIGALLAGAGVIGLAVGFGAQSLVKDVITGAFILIEDSIAVGDVVDVAGQGGVVESLSIRSVRLRDLNGTVHVIPFGEVTAVQNMAKDFAFAVVDMGVAYREDVDEVIQVLKEIGAVLAADATYGPLIMEPLEVLGVDEFGSSAVVVKVRFKTRPMKQWMVKREFLRRVKRVFDEKGIEIPFSTHTVYFGADKKGLSSPARLRIEADAATAPANNG